MDARAVSLAVTIVSGGTEYSLSSPRRITGTGNLPANNVSSLIHKRVLENEANTIKMTVVDSTAYDIESLLMTMGTGDNERQMYFQYGFTIGSKSNLSRIFRSTIWSYTPTIASNTTSLELEAVSNEPRGTKNTYSSSYSSSISDVASAITGVASSVRDTAACITALKRKFTHYSNSVMKNYTTKFISICNKYGVDPILAASISCQETGWWRSSLAVNNYNIGGMMYGGSPMSFSSMDEGIDKFVKNLKELYYDEGLTTPETIGPKYCVPPDSWISSVRLFLDAWVEEYNEALNSKSSGTRSLRSVLTTTRTRSIGLRSVVEPPILDTADTSSINNIPAKISDIFKVICKRNGWNEGIIEETTDIDYFITQYNISDLDFIKTKLIPSAISNETKEQGYVFYMTNKNNKIYANFHIPKATSPSKSFNVLLDKNGGIQTSKINYDKNTNSVFSLLPRSEGGLSNSVIAATNAIRNSIYNAVSEGTTITPTSTGTSRSGDRFRYGTNTSLVLSWKPSIVGSLFWSSENNSSEYCMMNVTGDTSRSEAIDAAASYGQYDDTRSVLGASHTNTIKRSSANKSDEGSRANLAWTKAKKYQHTCSAEILGDHTISFSDTIEFNIYLQGRLHYTSGNYLVNEVTDTINSTGFHTSLEMCKNSTNGGRIGYDDTSNVVGSGLGNQIALQLKNNASSIVDTLLSELNKSGGNKR